MLRRLASARYLRGGGGCGPRCTRDSAFPGRARRRRRSRRTSSCRRQPRVHNEPAASRHRSTSLTPRFCLCTLLPARTCCDADAAPIPVRRFHLYRERNRANVLHDGYPLSVLTTPTVFLHYIIVKMSVFLVYDSIKLW